MTHDGFLHRMAVASRARVRAARIREPEGRLLARAAAAAAPPPLVLDSSSRFDVIAELKIRSPAAGGLAQRGFDPTRQVSAYAEGGAAAVSVLTEPEEFGGALADLRDAAAALAGRCPAMRKDFLTDPYQVLEARAAGAGGVLVIATMLTDDEVRSLLASARECGLFVLLEAFEPDDLERVDALGIDAVGPPVLIGVNCRDLKTLDVDFARFARLARHLPGHLPAVAESGVAGPDDARAVAGLGYRLALVGSSLMSAPDPRQALARLIAAGRGAAED